MWAFKDAVAEGKAGPADLEEAMTDAAKLAIMDMTEAGVDILSDGEMFRSDFTWNFHEHVKGLDPIPFNRRLGYPGPDQLDAFRCVAPLEVPGGYGLAREVEFLKSRTDKPFVIGLQSPVTQAFRIDPGKVYRNKGEVAWALVPYYNRELKAAVAAGARHVQFDEPAFWTMPGGYAEWVDLFNACVDGVEHATVEVHLCFGNFRGRPATADRRYAPLAPHFQTLRADIINMEFANRGMNEADLWPKYGGDKMLCAGVIDVKGRSLEPVEAVADRIRTLLNYVPADRLLLAPDCGFSQTVRWLAVEKLKNLVRAAHIVRKEIGG
jgi:5-methyltetrahydropteroyltriglutamate--homocysteine methyltransferase